MEEGIRASMSANDETNARVKLLHDEIELPKMQLGALSKSNWVKSAAIRLANWLKDQTNRQLLKSGSDVATSLLLPSSRPPDDAVQRQVADYSSLLCAAGIALARVECVSPDNPPSRSAFEVKSLSIKIDQVANPYIIS